MARYGRGLNCLTLTRERCAPLRLPLMVSDGSDPHGTSFTVSIEAARGVTTGISAQDRARTIRTVVAAGAEPADRRQPGHAFPLMARRPDLERFAIAHGRKIGTIADLIRFRLQTESSVVRVLSAPRDLPGISAFGLEIAGYEE